MNGKVVDRKKGCKKGRERMKDGLLSGLKLNGWVEVRKMESSMDVWMDM